MLNITKTEANRQLNEAKSKLDAARAEHDKNPSKVNKITLDAAWRAWSDAKYVADKVR